LFPQYGEYKLEFRRQKLNEFFVLHKNQEWFKLKYHPVDYAQRSHLLTKSIKRRCDVFQVFLALLFISTYLLQICPVSYNISLEYKCFV
jgi:hypothetical protein